MSFLTRSIGCAAALALFSSLAACTSTVTPGESLGNDAGPPAPGDDGDAGANPAGTGDILQGQTIGTGVTPNERLRRKVPVTLLPGSDGFAAVDGYVFRASAAYGDAEYTAIRIKNTSAAPQCFVEAKSYAVKSASGSTLFTGDINRVIGFTGKTPDASRAYGDCIEPNGVGIFIDIQTTVHADDVASYEMQVTGDALASRPASRFVAQGFTVSATASGQTIEVTAKNVGTAPGLIPELDPAVVLDDALVPLQWLYFKPKDSTAFIAPNATTTLTGTIAFEGTSTHLLVSVVGRDN